jgi:hypothetical protein
MSGGLKAAGDLPVGLSRVDPNAEGDTPRSSPNTPHRRVDFGPPVTETVVADLERALSRDRSHAVLVTAPGSEKASLLRALAGRLAGSLHVVLLTDPGIGEDEICAQILARWGQEPAAEAEPQLMRLVVGLASRGSALVLLISDANCMPAETLRRLGRLASDSRRALRLALVVEVEGRREADVVADLVVTLGVGAEKVVLDEAKTKTETSAFTRPPRALPPTPVRKADAPLPKPGATASGVAQMRHKGSRTARWPRCTTAALGIAVAFFGVYQLAIAAASREVVPGPEPTAAPAPVPVEQSDPIALALPALPVIEIEIPSPVTASADPEPPSQHAEVIQSAPEPPPPTIAVSLNARPWARIEVDGSEVGITPLGDLPISPGPHRFRARLADGRVIERVVQIDAYRDHISFP